MSTKDLPIHDTYLCDDEVVAKHFIRCKGYLDRDKFVVRLFRRFVKAGRARIPCTAVVVYRKVEHKDAAQAELNAFLDNFIEVVD